MFHCGDLKIRNNNNLFHCQGKEEAGRSCHAELTRKLAEIKSMRNFLFLLGISASLSECIAKFPLLEERDRVRCLTEREQSEILRSSSTDLLQSNSLSLRMTNAFDNSGKLRHPERSEGSQSEQIIANSGIAELMLKSKFANVSTSSQPSPQGEGESCHAELVSAFLSKRIGNCPSPREEGVGERVQLKEKINPSLKIVSFRKMLKDNFSQPKGTQSHKVQLRFTCSASVSLGESSSYSKGFLKKCAFTLAEVLITLGVIGVVAAITIPGLMTKYRHHVMETKLAKFDSIINQAVRMSIAENGDIFYEPSSGKEANAAYLKEWFDENLLRYMKADYEGTLISGRYYKVNLLDGSGFVAYMMDSGERIHFFYCLNSRDKACRQESFDGKNTFVFDYYSTEKAVLPYGYNITDIQTLKYSTNVGATGCYNKNHTYHHYCAQLIKLNGWKIPKDYPW